MSEHTLKRFDAELDELNSLIKAMFKIVRKNIKQALQALIDGDTALANKVIKHDEAANIADNVLHIEGTTPKNLASIPVMQDLVFDQLKQARLAYLERSAGKAQTIIERDHLINEAFANTQRVMLTVMVEKPSRITQCMALINIAKILERVGDHITNIAEMVIYTDVGHEVRHIDREELRALLAEDGDDDE